MGILKKLTVINKGLRYKLMLAFALMSIIPLLACMYIISTYVFPQMQTYATVSIVVLASIVIAILGLILAKALVDPVIDMAIEARVIASGEYDRKVAVASDDEIGNLGQSINSMTQRIKSNLDELKNYGQRMREINSEVHKKVFALSSLLQIGDIISSGSAQIDSLLELAVEKAAMIFDTGFGMLFMPKDENNDFAARILYNIDREGLGELVLKSGGHNFLERALDDSSITILDKGTKQSKELEDFKNLYAIKNIIAIPIHSGSKKLGLLIMGNSLDGFKYKDDDIDLTKVFAKQITIAIESDILSKKTEELAIKDDLTGLYNKNYILTRLEEEIKRAIFYQRPCSFIVFNIDGFRTFREKNGEIVAEEALRRVAKVIKDNLGPVGKGARIGGDEFSMLLPEKNKGEASLIAEDVKKKIESTNLAREGQVHLTVSGGVSENPIDGTTSDELFKKAAEALAQAKASGRNKVIA